MDQIVSHQKDGKDNDSPIRDKIFDPSVDMLVNDFDDERTLEEEEALAAGESHDPVAELSNLQKVCLFFCLFYELITDDYVFFQAVSRVSEEEEEDYDYSPDEDEWRKVNKTIMVGSDYQAQIPVGLCHYDDALPYENEDKLLWDPSVMQNERIEDFLKKAYTITKPPIPIGTQLRDDEQALYMLQQCGHNVEEGLRRLRITVPANGAENMNESLWSEEECRNFESGVRCFGKNFHKIQQEKVRTRSVGELVQFYYLWKKSERHDIFANKARLEKKKYALHPGLTDFMDRFLEDQDSRDRSSSPNVQCGGNGKVPPDT
nr:mesoderm induction early response protein 1-like [Leptinotarsa decemlineata]